MQKPKRYRPTRAQGVGKFDGAKSRNDLYKTKDWAAFRFRFLYHNPKCYSCHLPSGHVDHLVPTRADDEGFFKQGNHVPLCHSCHSTVTMLFDRHTPPKTEEKKAWLQNQRKLHGLSHPIKVINA